MNSSWILAGRQLDRLGRAILAGAASILQVSTAFDRGAEHGLDELRLGGADFGESQRDFADRAVVVPYRRVVAQAGDRLAHVALRREQLGAELGALVQRERDEAGHG